MFTRFKILITLCGRLRDLPYYMAVFSVIGDCKVKNLKIILKIFLGLLFVKMKILISFIVKLVVREKGFFFFSF